ncbi:MAG: DUF4080 domain-containing protein [Bacilli bacterium]|nr:DUF4080 domain-containing protein [Bacilli bacterium]
MKTILVSINAKFIHTNNAVRLLKVNTLFPVDIFEYTIKDNLDQILLDLKEAKPDVIGFSAYIWNIDIILRILQEMSNEALHPYFKSSKIVLGGPEVSHESSHLLTKYPVDYILKGEAELTFHQLLTAINHGEDPSHIDGITMKHEGRLIDNPIIEITELNKIKLPYFLEEDIVHIPNKISYIESSRGCPYKCSYCLSSLEKKVRFFELEDVKKSIIYLMKHGSKTIKFLDRTFNANHNTFDLLKYIIDHHNGVTIFQFEITGDVLNKEIIHYLNLHAPKGLFRFEIGIQSINYETNYLVDRIQNNEVLFENIRLIQQGNVIDLHLDLIAGLPKEDLTSFKETFNAVYRLGAKELQLGFLKMLRGTKIRKEADKYHYHYEVVAPYEFIDNDSLSRSDKEEIHLVEKMLALYHNKGYFGNNLQKYILNYFSPYDFFYDIGRFYLENKIPTSDYQVHELYQTLFQFIDSEYDEFLLLIDYLRRSKIKPKLFWEDSISKQVKKQIFDYMTQSYSYLNLNILYKHSVVLEGNEMFYLILYQNSSSTDYFIKKSMII